MSSVGLNIEQLLSSSWDGRPYGHNRHRPKSGRGLMCPFLGGAGSPSNTVWPRLRPTSVPSGILIHPAVWPQYTNVTDRQDRTGQRFDSIGRTVLQTVAQKTDVGNFRCNWFCQYPVLSRKHSIAYCLSVEFWATVCKTTMLSDRCLSVRGQGLGGLGCHLVWR